MSCRSPAALLLGACLAVSAGAGCAASPPKRVDFSEDKRHYTPTDYPLVLANWTRHAKVVKDVGTVIELWATYKSWDFRQAYVERYVTDYELSDADRAALMAAQLEAVRKSYEFHAAVQTTNYKWNDLGKDTSAWRVTLIDGRGVEIEPTAIETPKLPEIYETQFFPNRTEFTTTYLIRFNRADAEAAGFTGPASGRMTLRVLSPLAKAEVLWEAAGPTRAAPLPAPTTPPAPSPEKTAPPPSRPLDPDKETADRSAPAGGRR